ncbi:FADD protein, partial [Centropus bengalensis]|nr:FADD protein [Centropus bengalensis]
MDPFRVVLHSIAARLSDDDVASLKFFCREDVGKKKLESVRNAMDLFTIFIEQRLITKDNVDYLAGFLTTMKREDLSLDLRRYIEEREVGAPGDQPDAREKPVRVIGENVGKDWKKLMRELDFSDVQMERVLAANPLNLHEQLVQSLLEWQRCKGKEAKADDLIKALRCCKMNLVADRVEQ